MPVPYLVIDGYNLMHAAGIARLKYGPGQLQKYRERFLKVLVSRLTAEERARTTIVFDGQYAPHTFPANPPLAGMEIQFSSPGSDADTLIEQILESHSSPRQVIVVSSDHRLQKAAKRRRANALDSEIFFADLEKRSVVAVEDETTRSEHPSTANETKSPHIPKSKAPKQGGSMSSDELKMWLEVFEEPVREAQDEIVKKSGGKRTKGVNELQRELDELLRDKEQWLDEDPKRAGRKPPRKPKS